MKLLRVLNESLKSQLEESFAINTELDKELTKTKAECTAHINEILDQDKTIEAAKSTIEDLMSEATQSEQNPNQDEIEAL